MFNPQYKAPHADNARMIPEAPNAALLIDFDNVTMGMRSDLAKELKRLLDSDIIKGKVTVQRAYADWRRYPQYIVPLSEASIDLIFAPAYGSSKKNATDIRMAIDGMELVFIRPEIGTFILLTGDSDFSSLVLKLKEYGKYVIGIGIQESSSDILVQNCDEYYSYTSLTGLSRASEGDVPKADAWTSLEAALAHMASRGDVMRSDRLKQVMMERTPTFDERSLGFKSFSKFLAEAASRGLVEIRRGDNGQYHVAPPGGTPAPRSRSAGAGVNGHDAPGRPRKGPQTRRGGKDRAPRQGDGAAGAAAATATGATGASAPAARATGAAVVREPRARAARGRALELLARAVRELGGGTVRDSDVKRKMLAIDRTFSEGSLGFGKFSKFLLFAAKDGGVVVERDKGGNFGVRLAPAPFDARQLGLPTTKSSIKSYLANRYKGVGVKTAERLVASFGVDVFGVLQNNPAKVRKALQRVRADAVIAAWEVDYRRRAASAARTSRAANDGRARTRQSEAPQRSAGDGAGSGQSRSRAASPVAATTPRGDAALGTSAAQAAVPRAPDADTDSRAAASEAPPAAAEDRDAASPALAAPPDGALPADSPDRPRGGLLGLLPWGRRGKDDGP